MNEVVPGKWFFMFAGNIEPDKILASDESLKDALRSMTERSDLKFGNVVYTTDYRYGSLSRLLYFAWTKVVLVHIDQAYGWSTSSARAVSLWLETLPMSTLHVGVRYASISRRHHCC